MLNIAIDFCFAVISVEDLYVSVTLQPFLLFEYNKKKIKLNKINASGSQADFTVVDENFNKC